MRTGQGEGEIGKGGNGQGEALRYGTYRQKTVSGINQMTVIKRSYTSGLVLSFERQRNLLNDGHMTVNETYSMTVI